MADTVDEKVKTQLKELEAILEESDRKIRQMVESIPNAMYVFIMPFCKDAGAFKTRMSVVTMDSLTRCTTIHALQGLFHGQGWESALHESCMFTILFTLKPPRLS